LQGDKTVWSQKTYADVVVYIRGYNTPPEKIKRMFDSLKRQTYQNFDIVYVDDASQNESGSYAEFILKYDNYFHGRTISFFNDTNVGELKNFVFVMQNAIVNRNAVVINLDNDDYLVNERAIERIVKEFLNGAEITCGNCVRYDKPLKKYKIYSFEKVWERDGDNIWLHPKCFKRRLFDYIDVDGDLKIDGKFIEVNTDFAFMLPMIAHSKKNVFIDEVLYYFEPSLQNIQRIGKYSDENKSKIKKILLERAKERENTATK
jgi:glycosyltransferase involved in cell wall biosynthesis